MRLTPAQSALLAKSLPRILYEVRTTRWSALRYEDRYDAALDAAVRAVQGWRPEVGPFRPYLVRAMRNALINAGRRHTARRRRMRALIFEPGRWSQPDADPPPSLTLEDLPPIVRDVADLTARGLYIRHIAVSLGIAPGTVKSRLGRVRAALRRHHP